MSPFDIRMLYAAHGDLLPYASRLGLNWVVVASMGHKGTSPEDDPPVLMPGYPKLAPRRRALKARIEGERDRIRRLIARAKKDGLKVLLHSYELSMPEGFQEAYPEYYSPEIREYVKGGPPGIRKNRSLCVARPEVREAISAKVEELIRLFPALDGFSYTNNESSSTSKVTHRCDDCRDLPFAKTMKLLNDAIAEGIRRSGRPVKLFHRCWGAHETDFMYYDRFPKMLDFGIREGDKSWMPAFAACFKPAKLHFVPSRDNPAYIRLMKGDPTGFIYKASWADVNIHHPLNPWIGAYTGHDQVCEFSFENGRDSRRDFFIQGREMQRRARRCRARGVNGLAAVPMAWGAQERWGDFSRWSLNEANLVLFAALAKNPDADLHRVLGRFLLDRYGRPLPADIAALLLETEDVSAAATNLDGVQVGGATLSECYYQLMRYGAMRPGWEKRLRQIPANRKRLLAAKDRAVRHAESLLARVAAAKKAMPRRAHEELTDCLTVLLNKARRFRVTHDLFLTQWGIKDGLIPATVRELDELVRKARWLEKNGDGWI